MQNDSPQHRVSWGRIVLPPVCLLLLMVFVPSVFSPFILIAAGIFAVASIFHISGNLLKYRKLRREGTEVSRDSVMRETSGPILILLLFVLFFSSNVVFQHSANAYAMEVAKRIQAECHDLRTCRPSIAEWNDPHTATYSASEMRYGMLSMEAILRYYTREDNRKFSIEVTYGPGVSRFIMGGVNDEKLTVFDEED
jgi:hypothetical protein